MSDFEIYFVGLICFICDQTSHTYQEADLLTDGDHKPMLYLGDPHNKFVEPSGRIMFDLPDGGPFCDEKHPSALLPHVKDYMTGSPTLDPNRSLDVTVILPRGTLDGAVFLKDEGVFTMPNGDTKKQEVSQLVVLSSTATKPEVTVSYGTGSSILPPASFVIIGHVSKEHDAGAINHFQKYKKLTQGGTGIAKLNGGNTTKEGAHPGRNFKAVKEAIKKIPTSFPNGKFRVSQGTGDVVILMVGQADCSSSQWP